MVSTAPGARPADQWHLPLYTNFSLDRCRPDRQFGSLLHRTTYLNPGPPEGLSIPAAMGLSLASEPPVQTVDPDAENVC